MDMKKLILILTIAASLIASASAIDLWFAWTPNQPAEGVTSYVIQQAVGTSSTFSDVVTAPGNTNRWVIKSVSAGSYKFRLVAVNGIGRSQPSSVILFPSTLPSAPGDFVLTNAPGQ